MMMGGRCAEEIFAWPFITTGAGNDIERATDIARKMVCEWGMSTLGPLAFGKKEEAIFTWAAKSRSTASFSGRHRNSASTTKSTASAATAYNNARSLLENNRETLERIALALLDREVLDATELKLLMENKPLPEKVRPAPPSPPQPLPSSEPKQAPRPELRPAPGFSKG